jgi:hypothetical protein
VASVAAIVAVVAAGELGIMVGGVIWEVSTELKVKNLVFTNRGRRRESRGKRVK